MTKMKLTLLVAALCLVLAPATSVFASQVLTMETMGRAAGLEKCDTLHHEQTCDRYHVAGKPKEVEPGTELVLEDPTGAAATYIVQGLKMVYNLADGSQVVEPMSSFVGNGSFNVPLALKGSNGESSKVLDSRLKIDLVRK